MNIKQAKRLAGTFKGVAHPTRVRALYSLKQEPEQSVMELSDGLEVSYKALSEHLRKLMFAGLIMKRSDSGAVRHALTDRGRTVLQFYRTLV